MKKVCFSIWLLIVTLLKVQGQNIPIGGWQTHFSPLSGVNIVFTPDKIYYTSYNGFFCIDPENNETRSFSKIDGLADTGISAIGYQPQQNLLLLAYRSGLIDFVFLNNESLPEQIESWAVLTETPGITASRAVNKIVFRDGNAYLCTQFGIVVLDIISRQVRETYRYIGQAGAEVAVSDITFSADSIFAVSSGGLLAASLSPAVNRQYFGNWKHIETPAPASALSFFNNALYGAFAGKGFFERKGNFWNLIEASASTSLNIVSNEATILLTDNNRVISINANSVKTIRTDPALQAISDVMLRDNAIWLADNKNGLLKSAGNTFEQLLRSSADTTISPRPDIAVEDLSRLTWSINPAFPGSGIIVRDQTGRERNLSAATGNGSLPSNAINSLAIDADDYVWFASDRGAGYFIPDGILDASRVDAILPVYGQRRLFSNEKCIAIAVEPGNRKWIATVSGLYLFNPDGTELIQKFDPQNSPLPTGQILALRMDRPTGLLYIETQNGMVSYRTATSEPAADFNNVTIFPNPVRPGFGGNIGFKGLLNGSVVKITEMSGRLIYETRSQGGTATWNLLDYTGKRTRGGIYLVLIVTPDGAEKMAGKLAVID